jgi:hypothetical protein
VCRTATSQRYNSLWALSRLDGAPSCLGFRALERTVMGASSGSHSRVRASQLLCLAQSAGVVSAAVVDYARSASQRELLGPRKDAGTTPMAVSAV